MIWSGIVGLGFLCTHILASSVLAWFPALLITFGFFLNVLLVILVALFSAAVNNFVGVGISALILFSMPSLTAAALIIFMTMLGSGMGYSFVFLADNRTPLAHIAQYRVAVHHPESLPTTSLMRINKDAEFSFTHAFKNEPKSQ